MRIEELKRIINSPISKVLNPTHFGHWDEGSHVHNLFNYWEPICQKTVNGVVYRVAEGLFDWEERRKTYLLYKNENLFAVFSSVNGAKEYVDKLPS